MKTNFTFLLIVVFAFGMNAQYIYNDFDANQNETFSGWPNVPVIVANPDASGINTSANVAQFDRTDWAQWDHVYSNLPGKIDFTTGTTFSVKVYSPISCDVLFKLEDQANGGIFVERLQSISSANQWVQLDFDFTGEASDTYDKIVIFFDFATFNANTFYFDDVEGPNYFTFVPKPLLAADVQDNFEDDGWGTIDEWFFQNPDLDPLPTTVDPVDGSNTVADYNRTGAFEWCNAQAELDHRLDLTNRNMFDLRVYFPSSNDYSGDLANTVAMKLQNSLLGGNAWTTQTEIIETVNDFDQWVTVTFDFSAVADSVNYDKIVIQFGGEGHWAPGQFYFDDLFLPYAVPPYIYSDFDENQNAEFEGWPNMPMIVPNPDASGINTSANVAEWQRSTEQWAHVYTSLGGQFDFSTGTNFQLKAYSPIACTVLLKLEDQNDPNINVQDTAYITLTNEWELLNFDFIGAATDTYDKIIVFFDFTSTDDHTFYFDEVTGPENDAPKPLLALDVQDNFEDDGWGTIDTWFFQDPNMDTLQTTVDPEDPDNTVADYNRSGSFEWTNAQFILDHRMDLSERNEFELDVYLPSSNDYSGALTPTAAIKLQNSLLGNNAWTTQTEVKITVDTYDEWVTLVFDFNAVADSVNYDQVVVQLGGEGHWIPGQFYFDNLDLEHIPYILIGAPNGGEEIEQNSSYTIEWGYDFWDGNINIELLKEGYDPEPIVNGIAASDTVFEWIVFYEQEPGDDYRIIIISTDGFPSDTSDAYFSIVEVEGVQANFEADPTLILVGDSVSYTDLSSGDPDTWEWYFEGGMPETYTGQTPPAIVYDTEGVFDVSLTVFSGDDQDILLKEDYITVGVPPAAGFEASDTLIIVNETVDFTNLSTGEENTYEWIFEGGDPATSTDENPTGVKYENEGKFDVTLIASNDFGTDTLIMTDYINVGTVGLEEDMNNRIVVFPNPATDHLTIKMPAEGIFNIYIQNISGQNNSILLNQNGMVKVNTTGFKSGVYFLSIFNNKNTLISIRKIIIHN